jgi:hypothetical protein
MLDCGGKLGKVYQLAPASGVISNPDPSVFGNAISGGTKSVITVTLKSATLADLGEAYRF